LLVDGLDDFVKRREPAIGQDHLVLLFSLGYHHGDLIAIHGEGIMRRKPEKFMFGNGLINLGQ
jgi:hypothetical protein